MDWVDIITKLGFPIACVIACGFFIYKIVNRTLDEAKSREETYIEIIKSHDISLNRVADTINASNETNRELSETNKVLVNEMKDKINVIDNNVNKLLDRKGE